MPNAIYPDWYHAFSGVIAATFNSKLTDQTEESILADLSGDSGWWLVGSLSKLVEVTLVDAGFYVTVDGDVKYIVDQMHPTRGVMVTEDPEDVGTYVWVFFDHTSANIG